MNSRGNHTVEKIGGTSMTRLRELGDTLLIGQRQGKALYNRIFVVSAFGGVTDRLLEHKKSSQPGVYGHFVNAEEGQDWREALDATGEAMRSVHHDILYNADDLNTADDFVRERIEGARSCLNDLQSLCSYGHFYLADHMNEIRELLSGLGESHSALVATLYLQRKGVNARLVDLSGWRDREPCSLEERLERAMVDIDPSRELPVVTGYAQCRKGLMREYDRGYSEVTFARLAALTGAREAIIHKEFHLSSADPRLVGADKVRTLGRTNYDVADQLANLGMEAIHPNAAKVLRQAGVPLRVTNAFEPGHEGTLIDNEAASSPAVEIVTGLDVVALELFEQDMVGVKGYDNTILDSLKRHNVRIVSKISNANTITHYVDASLKILQRVEKDLVEHYPSAQVTLRKLSLVSVIGRDLSGLSVLTNGLVAIAEHGLSAIGATQGPRNVEVQFLMERGLLDDTIRVLHDAYIPKKVMLRDSAAAAAA